MSSIKSFQSIYFALMGLVLGILILVTVFRIGDFQAYHTLLAKESVDNVRESIAQFIQERKRLVQLFADEHAALITQAIRSRDDNEARATLENKIHGYFPSYFAYTIADHTGKPYFEDFDGLIGELCRNDIHTYASQQTSLPRVHPHIDVYHYDLMASINFSNQNAIFFVSFQADELASFLRSAQTHGHNTMLVLSEQSDLIEVTVDGARNKWSREDYRMTENERERVLYKNAVPGTLWHVYDLREPKLFSEFRNTIVSQMLIIFLLFVFVGAILISFIIRADARRKKAEAIKQEFISIVSHELRTPLTVINGAVQILKNEVFGKHSQEESHYLNLASDNIDRLMFLVDDILDVKKLEAGDFLLQRKKIDLNTVLQKAVADNESLLTRNNVTLSFSPTVTPQYVFADENRLYQVMTNLISNAVKYGAANDKIELKMEPLGSRIRVSITDHGEGIAPEFQEKIFNKFVQAHSRSHTKMKGTGLGLNIVKNIIKMHDGMIDFKSEPGQGTTFYFELPLIQE